MAKKVTGYILEKAQGLMLSGKKIWFRDRLVEGPCPIQADSGNRRYLVGYAGAGISCYLRKRPGYHPRERYAVCVRHAYHPLKG